MAFYGEAMPLDWANPIDGAPFTDSGDAMRTLDGTTTILNAGDSFIVGFFDYDLLTAADPAVFQLAVQAVSGAASLRFSGGTDPDWTLDDPALATSPLGTFSVAAGGTVGVPMPFVDVAAYVAQDVETIVFVEVLSGTVEIEQLRLRIWPPTGPAGGLSALVTPSAETVSRLILGQATSWGAADAGNPSVDPPIPPSWSVVRTGAYAAPDGSIIYGGRSPGTPEGSTDLARWPQSGGSDAPINKVLSTAASTIRLATADFLPDPPGTYGVDWIYNPDAVERIHAYPDGLASIQWEQPIATLVGIPTGEHTLPAPPSGSADPSYLAIRPGHDLVRPTAIPPGVVPVSGVSSGVPPTIVGLLDLSEYDFDEQGRLTISLYHSSLVADMSPGGVTHAFIGGTVDPTTSGVMGVDYGSWSEAVFPNFVPLSYFYTPAPYRYWDPLADSSGGQQAVGYFVRGTPNLDGLGDGVVVTFN